MSTFLQKIIEVKHQEVRELAPQVPHLEALLNNGAVQTPRGFGQALQTGNRLNIVAEVKKASPSKGLIAQEFRPVETATTYQNAGASAVSVLTDAQFFQGSIDDLKAVRNAIQLPVLRKDFIIDESQVLEARVAGADAVLLIVAALERRRLMELSRFIKSLGMDVLIEVHSVAELDLALAAMPTVLGVNNRNLHTFEVSLDTTFEVLRHAPVDLPCISESGIHDASDALRMAESGIVGLLVGESLMRAGEAGIAQLLRSFRVSRATSPERVRQVDRRLDVIE